MGKVHKGGNVARDRPGAGAAHCGQRGWLGKDLTPADWRIKVDGEARAELESLAGALTMHKGSVEQLDATQFDLPALERLMARANLAKCGRGLWCGDAETR